MISLNFTKKITIYWKVSYKISSLSLNLWAKIQFQFGMELTVLLTRRYIVILFILYKNFLFIELYYSLNFWRTNFLITYVIQNHNIIFVAIVVTFKTCVFFSAKYFILIHNIHFREQENLKITKLTNVWKEIRKPVINLNQSFLIRLSTFYKNKKHLLNPKTLKQDF